LQVGGHTFYVQATDPAGNTDPTPAFQSFTVASNAGGTNGQYSGNEGQSVQLTGTAAPGFTTYSWSYAPFLNVDAGATCTFSSTTVLSPTIKCTDDGIYTVTLRTSNGTTSVSDSSKLTLSNVNPTAKITTPIAGLTYGVGSNVGLSSSLNDVGTNDKHAPPDALPCQIAWGDGVTTTGTVSEASGSGKCTGSHIYTQAGSYTITVTVYDDDGGSGTSPGVKINIK
jgi:hypothetical protein